MGHAFWRITAGRALSASCPASIESRRVSSRARIPAHSALASPHQPTCRDIPVDNEPLAGTRYRLRPPPPGVRSRRYRLLWVSVGNKSQLRFSAGCAAGDDVAKKIQLAMEYDPAPPFQAMRPKTTCRSVMSSSRIVKTTAMETSGMA